MSAKRRKSGKLRFNIIDFLIIVIVLGCMAGVVIRYNIIDRIVLDTKRDEVKISFMVSGMTPQIANAIVDGEEFYVVGTSYTLGKLNEHNITNARIVEANDSGLPVESFDDTLRDVRGSFTSYGVHNDDGFFLGGTMFLAPGKTLTAESKSVRFSLIITEISRVTGD